MFLRRALSEDEIATGHNAAVKALSKIKLTEEDDRLLIARKQVPFAGSTHLFFPIGRVKLSGGMKNLAVKIQHLNEDQELEKTGNYSVYKDITPFDQNPLTDEVTSLYLRWKGFPVPFNHIIGEVLPGVFATLTEDLGRIEEADGFDFNSLRNGAVLKRQYEEHVARLESMRVKDGLLETVSHAGLAAFRRAFGIVCNKQSGKGFLVMHDVHNISIRPDANEPSQGDSHFVEAKLKYRDLSAQHLFATEDAAALAIMQKRKLTALNKVKHRVQRFKKLNA